MGTAPVRTRSSPPDGSAAERDALDRILRSEVLDRAPNLVHFLRYVCDMHLAGRQEDIKEYNIAVEALGRSRDFDQKKDSIVRVEAHRLRKRLAEYYRTAGASDPLEIVIPAGTYIPEFRGRGVRADEIAAEGAASPGAVESAAEVRKTSRSRRTIYWTLAGVCLVLGVVFSVLALRRSGGVEPMSAAAPAPRAPIAAWAPATPPVRILAGGTREALSDHVGRLWTGDRYFTGGEVATAPPRPIARTPDPEMYLTRRQGDFEYRIPVPPGAYELRLHFAETVFGEGNVAGGGESSRVFGVRVNGGDLWVVDVIAEARGANTANIRVYRGVRPGPDGTVRIAFVPFRKEAAFVNAIELVPAPDARVLPIRIAARPATVIAAGGQEWAPDQYWLGGVSIQRPESIEGPEDSSLYQGERYGNFSYAIPVASGARYTLTLRFAENWFGPGRPGGEGAGSRVFDVYCNGQALLRNFDVFRTAGGAMRQLKKTFRGLEPNAQGKLNLEFVPVTNYALINAIEVVEEPR